MQLAPVILAPASWALDHLERDRGDRSALAQTIRSESQRLHRVAAGSLSKEQAQAERDSEKTSFIDSYGCSCCEATHVEKDHEMSKDCWCGPKVEQVR